MPMAMLLPMPVAAAELKTNSRPGQSTRCSRIARSAGPVTITTGLPKGIAARTARRRRVSSPTGRKNLACPIRCDAPAAKMIGMSKGRSIMDGE